MKVFSAYLRSNKSSILALLSKASSVGFVFLFHVVIARTVGVKGSGIYFLALTIIIISVVVSKLGTDNVIVKFYAAAKANGENAIARGIHRVVSSAVITASLIVTSILYAGAGFLSEYFNIPELENVIRVMCPAVPLIALMTVNAQTLQAEHRGALSVYLLSGAIPTVSLIFLLAAGFIELSVINVAFIYVLACLIVALLSHWLWFDLRDNVEPVYSKLKQLFYSAANLYGFAVVVTISSWLGVLMLAYFGNDYEVGLFSVANRVSMLGSLMLIAVNAVFAPKLSVAYAKKNIGSLRELCKTSARLAGIAAVFPTCLFIFASEEILMVFGQEFLPASSALIVLVLGQFVNSLTGPVALVLMMSENEKKVFTIALMSLFLGVLFSIYFVPEYGLIGAAWIAGGMVVFQNLLLLIIVKRTHGFWVGF
jgi:O-antigen/teichoic acid export membrane protein